MFSAGITAIALFATTAVTVAEPSEDPVAVQPAAPVPLPPEFDPGFYQPPAELVASKAPGEIIAVRQVNLANFGLIPVNVDAWQVSYRSNNSRDEPIAAVATVAKPRGSAPDKLVSMQIAEDSLAGYCAPSYCQNPSASVQYIREHFAEHAVTEVSGTAPAMLWLRDRLNGVPAQQGCSTTDVGWLALDPNGLELLKSTFGETFASFFGKPIGVK